MNHRKSSLRRSLRIESLESRALLAADVMLPHNFEMPEDCDDSGSVSPLDALVVINELNRPDSSRTVEASKMIDVDADGRLSPLDALIVINYMNRSLVSQDANPSAVPLSARIARLESSIARGVLPVDLGLNGAMDLLLTLKNGGLPEFGERFIEGKIHTRTEVDRVETEKIVNALASDGAEAEHANRVDEFLERFSSKLKSAGVDAKVIETISREIEVGIESKKPLTREQIKTRLTELGVDVSKLFPATQGAPVRLEPRIEAFIERVKAAGVDSKIINDVVSEVKSSVQAGIAYTLSQVETRLKELGVDLSKIFPINPPVTPPVSPPVAAPRWTPSVELVTRVLRLSNVKPATIEIVRVAMTAANQSGSPLSTSAILRLLKDNGVQIPEILIRVLQPVR